MAILTAVAKQRPDPIMGESAWHSADMRAHSKNVIFFSYPMVSSARGRSHEAAGIYRVCRQYRCGVALSGTRAAASHADGRVPQERFPC